MVVLALVAGCTDRESPTSPISPRAPSRTISSTTTHSSSSRVEVCQLNAAGACAGELVERNDLDWTPVSQRIQLDTRDESYSVNWMTGRSHVDAGQFYRARVLRNGLELGALDVQVVKNTPAMSSVNTQLYVGAVNGQQLERFGEEC